MYGSIRKRAGGVKLLRRCDCCQDFHSTAKKKPRSKRLPMMDDRRFHDETAFAMNE